VAVIMTSKRKHVADTNANLNSATSSKSKFQPPATDADVNSALIMNAQNGDEEAIRSLASQNALSAKEDEEVERLREEICRLRSDTAGALSAKKEEMRRLKEEISRLRSDTAGALSAKEDEMRRLRENIINRLRNANTALTGGIAQATSTADM
jgi:hypothetical protein